MSMGDLNVGVSYFGKYFQVRLGDIAGELFHNFCIYRGMLRRLLPRNQDIISYPYPA